MEGVSTLGEAGNLLSLGLFEREQCGTQHGLHACIALPKHLVQLGKDSCWLGGLGAVRADYLAYQCILHRIDQNVDSELAGPRRMALVLLGLVQHALNVSIAKGNVDLDKPDSLVGTI